MYFDLLRLATNNSFQARIRLAIPASSVIIACYSADIAWQNKQAFSASCLKYCACDYTQASVMPPLVNIQKQQF